MFFSYQGKTKEQEHRLWGALRKAGIFKFDAENMGSNNSERNELRKKALFELTYTTPFRIGLAVYYSMPSPASEKSWGGVSGLQKLFGKKALKKIWEAEKLHINELIRRFIKEDGAVITFQKDAWNGIKAKNDRCYSRAEILEGYLMGECDCCAGVRLYCAPTTRNILGKKSTKILVDIKKSILNMGKYNYSALKTPLIIMGLFWAIAITLWQTMGNPFYVFNFGYIGTAIGLGMGLYSVLPNKKKLWGRRISQLLVGTYMLVFLGLIEFENMQIEGFFFYLLAGFFAGSAIHFLVAKVAGPVVFNRGWCSWACWTAMVLDLLPFHRNKAGRHATKWGNLRYVHFVLSLGLVLALWLGVGYRVQPESLYELYWLAAGNVFYYVSAITLAFTLKDNRAFCKYVCPITTILKLPSRFALLKIAGDIDKCDYCGACEKICPMDIRVTDYIKSGQRILSTECILCLDCTNVCSRGALAPTWGFDCSKQELIRMKEPSTE